MIEIPAGLWAVILVHTGALVWWAGSTHAMLKRHDADLRDHDSRLRKAGY